MLWFCVGDEAAGGGRARADGVPRLISTTLAHSPLLAPNFLVTLPLVRTNSPKVPSPLPFPWTAKSVQKGENFGGREPNFWKLKWGNMKLQLVGIRGIVVTWDNNKRMTKRGAEAAHMRGLRLKDFIRPFVGEFNEFESCPLIPDDSDLKCDWKCPFRENLAKNGLNGIFDWWKWTAKCQSKNIRNGNGTDESRED